MDLLFQNLFLQNFYYYKRFKSRQDEIMKNNAGLVYETSNKADLIERYKEFLNLDKEKKN